MKNNTNTSINNQSQEDIIEVVGKKSPAQKWLDEKYPKEKRKLISHIVISYFGLEKGSLDLREYINLERFECRENRSITSLDLTNLTNLKYVDCAGNDITSSNLKIEGCINIETLICDCNEITSIDFSSLDSEKVKVLRLFQNNLKGDIEIFSRFINLEELSIGSPVNNVYNKFFGSLKSLQNLTKLKELYIDNTDIDDGLEYLPENLIEIAGMKDEKWKKGIKDAGVLKICEQLKNCDYNLQKWREKNVGTPANDLLQGYFWKNRQRELDFSRKNSKNKLKGSLNLLKFTELEKLDLSDNWLSGLNLSGCCKLTELNVSNNRFTSIDFLENLPNPEKITKLNLSNNSFPAEENFKLSLKKMENLEHLDITNTHIDGILEYLPESCKKLVCNSSYQHNSLEVANELDKNECSRGEGKDKYYDLNRWRKDKQNKLISTIPLERLFVIRSNLKQFINKWGKKYESDWYDNLKEIFKKTKDKANNLNELDRLQSPNRPDELRNDRWAIYGTQAFGRSAAVAGAALTFQEQGAIGGGILAIYPFTELLISKLEESLKNKEDKWKEFLSDADTFLDNFHELLAITKSIKISRWGIVNEELKKLKEEVEKFLKDYDTNDDGEIDVNELKGKRKVLAQELEEENEESKLWKVINAVKRLENRVIAYRQGIEDIEKTKENKESQEIKEDYQSSIEIPLE